MEELLAPLFIFGIPAISYYVIRFIIGLRFWFNGKVPLLMTFNRSNLLEVYIAFAVLVIKSERKGYEEKFNFMVSFVKKKFPNTVIDFLDSYSFALKEKPVKINPAARWLKLYLNKRNRLQLVFFLCELAMQDGRINDKEKTVLIKLCKRLKIWEFELDSIIAGLEEARKRRLEEEYYQRERTRKTQEKRKPVNNSHKKDRMARILGIASSSPFTTIKKAYRKLVKLHHPDRFHNNGPEQIQMAKERFIEIQLAYEYFEERK